MKCIALFCKIINKLNYFFMQMSFAVIKDLEEFGKKCTLTKARKMKIINNKLVTRSRSNKKITLYSILLGKSVYFKDINNNYYNKFYELISYNEISETNLIEIDYRLVVDAINKYLQEEENFNLLIFKLKHKCYLNIITSNYYYIFRLKNNNFKLIKEFKLWYKFGIDEKNNLYYINSIMRFYKVSKTSHLYNRFFDLVNIKYKNVNSIIRLIATRKNHQLIYYNFYEIRYRKKKVHFKLKKIYFTLNLHFNLISLEANEIRLLGGVPFLFII